MADERIISQPLTTTIAGDDYLVIDGSTGGTKKIQPVNLPVSSPASAAIGSAITSERTAAATLTNKTISGSSNTLTNLPAAGILGIIPIANIASGTPDGTKFVADNGTLKTITGGGNALTSNPLSQFATTTSAQLLGVISDETGSGVLVFNTSPTLITPALGTPSALILTNATGLPVGTGIGGLATGVAAFLATPTSANLMAALTNETGTGVAVFNTSPTLITPALGTPSSIVLTNATGLPIAGGGTGATTANNARVALNKGDVALTDGATVAIDASLGNSFTLTLTATGHAMGAPSNLAAGATFIFKVKQAGAGGYTLTWNSAFKWPGGTAPVMTATANAMDVISGTTDGTSIYCSFIQDVK